MVLSDELSCLELSEEEKKLRDGIFNMETIRFGKIPEIMIKKKYGYSFPTGTTEYDLKGNLGERIEVKFSCVREKEEDITENNVLSICFNNADFRADRKINSNSYQNTVFDCNIQQVKPDLFTSIYYGLFFEDRIAVFVMTSEDMLNFFAAKQLAACEKKLKKAKDKLVQAKDRHEMNSEGKLSEKYIRKRIEEDIPALLKQVYEILKKIKDSKSKSYELAKSVVIKNNLLNCISKTIKYITDSSKKISKRMDKCEISLDILEGILVLDTIPDSSTKQHLKSDGEGQFHIKNSNLEWHLNSGYFKEWITYKELYDLLSNNR